jgi:hypothetical protein
MVVAASGTEIRITFDPTDAAAFLTLFRNTNVFMNTEPGWMTDASGRGVAPLNDYSILFSVR